LSQKALFKILNKNFYTAKKKLININLKKVLCLTQTKKKAKQMDGLTQFAQLILKREGGLPIDWAIFETAYQISKTSNKNPTPLPQPSLPDSKTKARKAWGELNPEQRKSGFIVALANAQDQNEFLKRFEVTFDQIDLSLILDLQDWCSFDITAIVFEDLKIEQLFLKTNFGNQIVQEQMEFLENMYSNAQNLVFLDPMQNDDHTMWVKLAGAKYVLGVYDVCNTTKATTYQSMTGEEQQAFRTCIKSKLQLIGSQENSDDAIQSFIETKFYYLDQKNYVETARNELKINDISKVDSFEAHTLSSEYMDISFFSGHTMFWEYYSPIIIKQLKIYNPDHSVVLMLGNALKDASNNAEFITSFYNFCGVYNIQDVRKTNIKQLNEQLPFQTEKDLNDEEKILEVETFKMFGISEEEKKDAEKLKTDDMGAANRFPFLRVSKQILKNAIAKKADASALEKKEEKTPKPPKILLTKANIENELTKAVQSVVQFDTKMFNILIENVKNLFYIYDLYSKASQNIDSAVAKQYLALLRKELRILIKTIFEYIDSSQESSSLSTLFVKLETLTRTVTSQCSVENCTDEIKTSQDTFGELSALKTQLQIKDEAFGEGAYQNGCEKNTQIASKNYGLVQAIDKIPENYEEQDARTFIQTVIKMRTNIIVVAAECVTNQPLKKILKLISGRLSSCAKKFVKKNYQAKQEIFVEDFANAFETMKQFAQVLIDDFDDDLLHIKSV